MTKYVIVPVLPNNEMLFGLMLVTRFDTQDEANQAVESYEAMLAARPPLDAEMQQALELARQRHKDANIQRDQLRGWCNAGLAREDILAIALLRANGEEVT